MGCRIGQSSPAGRADGPTLPRPPLQGASPPSALRRRSNDRTRHAVAWARPSWKRRPGPGNDGPSSLQVWIRGTGSPLLPPPSSSISEIAGSHQAQPAVHAAQPPYRAQGGSSRIQSCLGEHLPGPGDGVVEPVPPREEASQLLLRPAHRICLSTDHAHSPGSSPGACGPRTPDASIFRRAQPREVDSRPTLIIYLVCISHYRRIDEARLLEPAPPAQPHRPSSSACRCTPRSAWRERVRSEDRPRSSGNDR